MDDRNKIRWFAMLAHKQENSAEKALSGKDGLEYYIVKHYVVRTFHGKKKRLLVPYLANLVFVHACRRQIIAFKERYNFLKFVMCRKSTGLEYLIVPDRQMEDFIRVTSDYEQHVKFYRPEEINLPKGTRVRVLGGLFDGVEGVFMKVRGKRSRQVVVVVPDVMAVSVEVHPDLIEILD